MMKCEDVNHLLDSGRTDVITSMEASVAGHLRVCENCRHAWHASMMLRGLRELQEPSPRSDLLEDILTATALQARRAARRGPASRIPSIVGIVGVAAAVGLAAMMITGFHLTSIDESAGTSADNAVAARDRPVDIAISLHETRALTLAIDSVDSLVDAQIRVALTGGIELEGMPGRRDINWTTDIAAGVNRLALQVVALVDEDSEILVEVAHGHKRRRFVVPIDIVAGV